MATLVLGAVGTAIGGPLGGAIGAALGSRVDHALLDKPRRRGPLLGDLSVQTSSYGSAIPKLFGTMRVAGTVIWATDLREDVHKSGGGKAGAKTTSYSYSASFAVVLSARAIVGVGRIWADGRLLRTSGGEWRSETGFRLWTGGEDQPVDPLIAGAEAIASTPAYRGLAYAVFENLQLADFGNRIPSLTFEVEADAGDVAIGAVAEALSHGAIGGDDARTIGGYAASGASVRGALEALGDALPIALRDDGTRLTLDQPISIVLAAEELGATATAKPAARMVHERAASDALPAEMSISYYDPARDYQPGSQRARRGAGMRAVAIDLPVAIGADVARGLAEAALARAWARRETRTLRVPWRRAAIRAGDVIALADGRWRVRERVIEHLAVELALERDGPVAVAIPAGAGRAIGDADVPAGATMLALLDLPALDDRLADAPQVWLAAAGTAPGWRRAEASLSWDGGASWSAIRRTAAPATMGAATTVLGPGPKELFDRRNMIEVDLLHEGMALAGASDAALIAGANLAALGAELIQFGEATQLSATRWRLGGLLRGRRGTDDVIAGHAAGERFVLLDAATLLAIDVPLSRMGVTLRINAIGPGDGGVPASVDLPVGGRAAQPLAPVALRAERASDGAVRFAWARRSRAGWAWIDNADVPLAEDVELYAVELWHAGVQLRSVELGVPSYDYSSALQAVDGWTGGAIELRIRQRGTRATSLPAFATWDF